MTRSWLVRLGKFGEQETHALETGELATGWQLEDIGAAKDRQAILAKVQAAYPDQKPGTLQNWAVQINQLARDMADGDLVIVPLKTTGQLAIGRVKGGYVQSEDNHPARHVEWLRADLPRSAAKQDLLYSLGATQTVCEISRNDAARRFEALAKTGTDPGPNMAVGTVASSVPTTADAADSAELAVNIEQHARDQIERHIAAHFAGHAFTELIAAILRAQGYQARVSPPGADKGVDIVAGQGALGFDAPRLVVQVKSGGIVADQPTLQGLLGCVQDTQAGHGLLVSWSGFTSAVPSAIPRRLVGTLRSPLLHPPTWATTMPRL